MNQFKTIIVLASVLVAIEVSARAVAQEPQADAGAGAVAPAEQASDRLGRLIRMRMPIDGREYDRTRRYVRRLLDTARREKKRPVLVFEFAVPAEEDAAAAAGSQFGSAYEMADFLTGPELSEANTVAFIPGKVEGHAVLVALACNEIIMAPEAELGPASLPPGARIEAPIRSAYREIASRRKTIPVAVALGLLDPAQEVWSVETEVSREFVTTEELPELEKKTTVKEKEVLFPAGQPGILQGKGARRLGLVGYLADSLRDVAKALDLDEKSLVPDPSLGEEWRTAQVRLEGPITAASVDQARRMIEEAVTTKDANFLCLWINSPGGSPVDSMRLASAIAALPVETVRTTAYIPEEARADAALVALACDQIFMAPGAILGGSGAYEADRGEIDATVESIRGSLAPAKSRDWSLPAAIIDPGLEVYECTRMDERRYWSDAELAAAADPGSWKKGNPVTTPGQPFQARGEKAVDFELADRVVESFREYKAFFGLQDDPQLLEPSWADILIEALASPGMAMLLFIIGGVGLYAELQSPGIGVGGFIFLVCFLLFFWSRYLGATAGWLEAILFLAGLACVLLEVFVLPGFGIFGLGGGALILAAVILAGQTFIVPQNAYQYAQFERSLMMLGGSTAGVLVGVYLVNRYLPHAPFFNKMILAPPDGTEAEVLQKRESLVDYGDLLGETGVTTTKLVPSGKARFGDRFVDVIAAESDIIGAGVQVVVTDVHGARVLVRPVADC